MKWLITGGFGFIGSNVANRVLAGGHEVLVLDDFSRKGSQRNRDVLIEEHDNYGHPLGWIAGDISNPLIADTVIRENRNADAILHLAGQVAVTSSLDNPERDFLTNAYGTFNLLESVRKYAPEIPLVFASTNKVYGQLIDLHAIEQEQRYTLSKPFGIGESRPVCPVTPYACSKAAADQYVRDYANTFGLRATVFRLSSVYGPRQLATEDQGWVTWLAWSVLARKPITIYGNGKQVRDILWVGDLVDLFMYAVSNIDKLKGQAYNVGGGPDNDLSILELIDRVSRLCNFTPDVRYTEPRPGDQKVYISDIRKISNALKWNPEVGMEEGLRRLCAEIALAD